MGEGELTRTAVQCEYVKDRERDKHSCVDRHLLLLIDSVSDKANTGKSKMAA